MFDSATLILINSSLFTGNFSPYNYYNKQYNYSINYRLYLITNYRFISVPIVSRNIKVVNRKFESSVYSSLIHPVVAIISNITETNLLNPNQTRVGTASFIRLPRCSPFVYLSKVNVPDILSLGLMYIVS